MPINQDDVNDAAMAQLFDSLPSGPVDYGAYSDPPSITANAGDYGGGGGPASAGALPAYTGMGSQNYPAPGAGAGGGTNILSQLLGSTPAGLLLSSLGHLLGGTLGEHGGPGWNPPIVKLGKGAYDLINSIFNPPESWQENAMGNGPAGASGSFTDAAPDDFFSPYIGSLPASAWMFDPYANNDGSGGPAAAKGQSAAGGSSGSGPAGAAPSPPGTAGATGWDFQSGGLQSKMSSGDWGGAMQSLLGSLALGDYGGAQAPYLGLHFTP